MKTLFGKSKTILSEKGVNKVSIYEMDPHKSGKLIKLMCYDLKISSHLVV